jgi:hypothetical protein
MVKIPAGGVPESVILRPISRGITITMAISKLERLGWLKQRLDGTNLHTEEECMGAISLARRELPISTTSHFKG